MQSSGATIRHGQAAAAALAALELSAPLQNHVGGGHVSGAGPVLEVLDPATADPFATFHDGDEDLVSAAVEAAATAQPSWARVAVARGRALYAVAGEIRASADDLAVVETIDTGKPLVQARGDVETAARYFEFYAGLADKVYGETFDQPNGFAYTRREPYGVVGIITPWNSPIAQMARSVAPALAAGNTVVVKPSELTPVSSVALSGLMARVGVPPGVCNVVLGTGSRVGAALAAHPDVRHVGFTGSVSTGRTIAHLAADRIASVGLELGGKSPTLVLADADLDAAAVAGADAVVRNSGQSCFATTRLIVARSIHDQLVERIVDRMGRLTVGPGLSDPDLGPLASAAQLARVREFIERAVADGARVANGDASAPVPDSGYFIRPHLVVGADNQMEIAREEVFGPVQTVIAVDDEEEAIAVANDSSYGLAAGIFTSSISKAHGIAARLEAGQVQVNRFPMGGVDTPFGGFKQSGLGREKGVEAIRHYTQLKTVIVDLEGGR